MSAKDRISLFEEDSKILERIANQYGEESSEYVKQFEGELTPEQRKHLIEMGIDPDGE